MYATCSVVLFSRSLIAGHSFSSFFFFFNDTATTEIYTLSLHDALPISTRAWCWASAGALRSTGSRSSGRCQAAAWNASPISDRKSTRLNSSHQIISYAVFCLKKKKHHYTVEHYHGTAATEAHS